MDNPQKKQIKPQRIVRKLNKKPIEAYKSNIGNLFTDNDQTLNGSIQAFTEEGYFGDVIKSQTIYDNDELCAGLIDRMRYTANQNINFNISSKYVDEEPFWKEWSISINETANNVVMGLKDVTRKMFDSLLKTGLAYPEVQWGTKRINGKTYEVPITITLLPVTGCKLIAGNYFGDELVVVGISEIYEKYLRSEALVDKPYDVRYFGDPTNLEYGKRMPYIEKPDINAIKFNWSENNMTLYPVPLLKKAFASVSLRHKYLETDMSLLDGIIERIVLVRVGDKDIELSVDDEDGSGDLTAASEIFEEGRTTQYIVAPYYYNIDIIQPDTQVLLKQDKYVQTTANIMNAFGIILDPSNTSNISNEDKLNMILFKEYITELQDHVSSWITKLCREIVRRNSKLKSNPIVTFDRPDFDDVNLKAQFISLYNLGTLDVFSLLEKFNFNPDTIVERLKKQKEVENKLDIFNVRSTFKQEAQKSNGNKTTSDKIDEGKRPRNEMKKPIKGEINGTN